MMNFLKDWIIQYQNKFSVGGTETTIDRITGTVSQEGEDILQAGFLRPVNEHGVVEIWIHVKEEYMGKGFGTEAIKALTGCVR